MPRAIVLNSSDNVATLIDNGLTGESCTLQGEISGRLTLLENVPFGHKICIADTPEGSNVLKYGQIIGKTSHAVKGGEHMHVHNIDSNRGRGDLNKGVNK